MFIKPSVESVQVPYESIMTLGKLTPVTLADEMLQDIHRQYRGIEYTPDETTYLLMYFGEDLMKQFRVSLNWSKFTTKRVVEITNIDELTLYISDYIMPKVYNSRFEKDIMTALYTEMLRVYVTTVVTNLVSDITNLPCYNEFVKFDTVDMSKVHKVDMDSVYIVYE